MGRTAQPPGLLALLLHTLRTDLQVPRRLLLDWAGIDERQYGRWVRDGQRPDRRGREKLAAMFPHVMSYLERVGYTWDDVVDRLPEDCRYRALRTTAEDGNNPLLVAADLDADGARGAYRPEYDRAQALARRPLEDASRSTGFGLDPRLEEHDAVDLVYAVVAAVCSSDVEAERLTRLALASLRDAPLEDRPHLQAYRAAVDVTMRERPAPPNSFRPSTGSPRTYLALLDPMLATAVVLADQELVPLDDIATVLGMHPDYVQARVCLGRRELLALGWRPS